MIYIILIIFFILAVSIFSLYFFSKKRENKVITSDFTVELLIHDSVFKSLIILNSGTIIFKEVETVSTINGPKQVYRTSETKVSSREIESLKKYILDNNFFSLKERYEAEGARDFVGHTIIVTIGSKTHIVYCYYNCPKEFNEIKEKIKSLWPDKIKYYGFS